jgi:hypothetical protein
MQPQQAVVSKLISNLIDSFAMIKEYADYLCVTLATPVRYSIPDGEER